jgi:hypothetical protein
MRRNVKTKAEFERRDRREAKRAMKQQRPAPTNES